MKIEAIRVFQVDLPLVEGRYAWADGRSVEVFDSTVVQIETDQGVQGFGEVCPLGPFYLPAFAAGARAGISELAPHLLGVDPTQLGKVDRVMDAALTGHPYVKSALDVACWDAAGKVMQQPLCHLLGGRFGDSVALYRAISQRSPEEMAVNVAQYREEGYRKFQLKVGGDPSQDIARIRAVREILDPDDVLVADANTGWLAPDAIRVANAVADLEIFIEQPCASYDKCRAVREHTDLPFILDENIDGLETLLRAHADRAMDVVNLKIARIGGLTRARQLRDLCVSLGIPMTIEDSWGGDIATAAIAHLAHSTPERYRFSSTDFNSYVTVRMADGAPRRDHGAMTASTEPGLGVRPDMSVLGRAVAEHH